MVRYKTLLNVIENYTEKCNRGGATGTSGIIYPQGEIPKFEPNGKKLTTKELNEIADTMAERYGLEVSVDSQGKREVNSKKFVFWDDNHKTEINLSTLIERQDEVDFTNRGYYESKDGGQYKSTYTLEEVLSYYNEMPVIMKDAMGGVLFKGRGCAYSDWADGRVSNPIVISHNFMSRAGWFNPRAGDNFLQRIMYHEGGHAIENQLTEQDYSVMKKAQYGKGKFSPIRLDTKEEREIYHSILNPFHNPKRYVYSDTQEYEDAIRKNDVKFASRYGKSTYLERFGHNQRCEDFAETMSMVAMSKTKNSEIAVLENNGINKFKKDHEATWKLCEDILDGKVKHTDLKRMKDTL